MTALLHDLNTAQRDAVLADPWPLLIVAGAGTGKTKVLTHRIAHWIESKRYVAEEILALTFTEKAAQELEERLDQLLPYGYGDLWVKTYHGFCEAILRESGLEMGLDTAYRVLTQTDLLMLLREKLFTFTLKHYRPLGNPTRFLAALTDHFSHLRDELVTVEAYRGYAKNLGDERAHELAEAYARYEALLLEENVMDFAGLQFWALRLLTEHPHVLSAYQARFKAIVVDEFQDTNTAQGRIVELLGKAHQNLTVVGDDDQSIYQWRGASLANILEFETIFPNPRKIVLTENYRSTQPILDLAYAVIQHNNPHRLEVRNALDKRLVAAKDGATEVAKFPTATKPEILRFSHYLEEVDFVVKRIAALRDEGVPLREMAILVRASAHAVPFVDRLTREEIPVTFYGAQGLFQREEIRDLLAVLRSLVNREDDIALFRFLSMKTFGFEMEYLLQLLQKAKSTSSPLFAVLSREIDSPNLFTGVGAGSGLSRFLELFASLQKWSRSHPASHVLGTFLRESGYLAALEESTVPTAPDSLQAIATFSQMVEAFERAAQDPRLPACLEYLRARQDVGDRAAPSEVALDADTVKVLTIHAAKGLEFEAVFVVNLVQQRFPAQNRSEPLPIPPPLLSQALEDASPFLSEERRLFYVAVTRAKTYLTLTSSERYEGRKAWKPSVFVQEAMASGFAGVLTPPEASHAVTEKSHIAVASDSGEKPLVFGYEREHRSLRLSFSKINTFTTCPLQYKFRYLYQLAGPLPHAASFGSSIHNTLNAFYRELLAQHKARKSAPAPFSVGVDRLRELYNQHWIPQGYENRAHLDTRKAAGWAMLQRFYETNSKPWALPAFLEQAFTLKTPSGLTLSGRIDRIDRLDDGTFEVIDYKTGRVPEEKSTEDNLQLSLYALACRDVLKIPASRFSLYYLEGDEKLTSARTPEHLAKTEQELEEIARTIALSPLTATPSPRVCSLCEYRLLCDKAMA